VNRVELLMSGLRRIGQVTPHSEREVWNWLYRWHESPDTLPDALGVAAFAHALDDAMAQDPDSLDAAWAEAEALCKARNASLYVEIARSDPFVYEANSSATGPFFGPTPAAALRALAAKLRGEA
jgi:hypothetical protein